MTAAELLSLADTAEVNSVGQDGRTALHRAALLLQSCNRDEAAEVKKAIRVLLQHGATVCPPRFNLHRALTRFSTYSGI
eukprot:m.30751 g.30751  ORF g.30751 m.30751 type:complete len:79 (-) comp6835_c0_seq1:1879-2115(-)